MQIKVQKIMQELAEKEKESLPHHNYPTVSDQFREMKRVALADFKDPTNPEEVEDLLRFAFIAGYNSAMMQQIVLDTAPNEIAQKVKNDQMSESITEIRRISTYMRNKNETGSKS